MLTDAMLLLGLIVANGALALSEIAIVSARRTRLAQMAETGSVGASRALSLAAEPTRFLSSVQVGITTIGIMMGAIGEVTLARPLRAGLEQVPALAPHAQALALVTVVVGLTYVSLIIGELVPKRLAMADPERIAALIARPMQVVSALGRPVVFLLSVSTDAVLSLLPVRTGTRAAVSIEEIKVLLEQGATEGVLEPGEREMMTNVLNLDERPVAGVLTPRADVVYLDVQADAGANRAKLRDDPHEILPLCDGGLEHVLGFVRARRVLEGLLAGRPLDLEALVEPALFVPEAMTIMRLLEEFKRRNLSAALVVDEFGDVEGIVSLTDVVTAIVGDLPADAGQEPAIVGRDDGSWLLDGALDVAVLAQTLEDDSLALDGGPGQRYHTLGGLAMASLGRMPRTGDSFTRGRYRFEIVDMDGNRVDRVLATLRPPGP